MKVLPVLTSIPAKVLVFRVGDQFCSLPVECVQEILHRPELVPAPGQPSVMEGFLNLRGVAYPVIQLRKLFGLPSAPPDMYAPLALVRAGGLETMLEVDEIESVSESGGTIRPFSDGASPNECAQGMLSIDGAEVTLLSCDRILLAQEAACLAELRNTVQQRLRDVGSFAE